MAEIQNIVKHRIDELTRYPNNAKIHPEKQIQVLAESIKEFGFINPVLIDKEKNVIAGHGRLEAAASVGLKEVPCLYVEGLTAEQARAFIIADNRIAEFGKWDKDLLAEELESITNIDFDIDSLNFELPSLDRYYGDERERTNNAYNLDIAHTVDKSGDFWEMPIVNNDQVTPDRLIGFNYAKTNKDKKCGIHFFVDDYQFERIWNKPEKYIDILKEYECILTPDFSLYMDMPMPMKIWNVYRSRAIGAYYQGCGLKVIPTISWAEEETFCFAFCGIPKNSIVAVSTIGVKENADALNVWRAGMNEMIKQIEPSKILVYGGELDFDYQGIEVKHYDNEVLKAWKD